MLTAAPNLKLSLLAGALGAALLSACGGGGSDSETSSSAAALDDATATTYAANATQIASDAGTAADTAVLTAQAVVGATATASASEGMATALSVLPLATTTRACPGGGTATLSITGGTPASQVNGQLDAGEVYAITFAACAGAAGAAAVDGSLAMTVLTASGDSSNGTLALSLTATDLSVDLPRGGASLNGAVERTVSVSTDSGGVVHLASHFTTPSLTLATHYNTRSSNFTLSAVDIQRTLTLVGGVPQSSTLSGTHTLSATLPNASFAYTVSTSGGASYSAAGLPVSGNWTITLPQTLLGVSIANGSATLTIDKGKDGSIDRTITVSAPTLGAGAG